MTIGGFIIGALIICILIYFIAQAAGLFKFGSKKDDADVTATPTPTEAVSDEEQVKVPTIVGMTPEVAQQTAKEYNLGITKVAEAQSNEFPAGTICAQSPKANTMVDKNTTITYTISTGSSEMVIPDVVNRTASEAQQMLADAGITNVKLEEKASAEISIGNVISVNPSVGATVTADDQVTLTISTGASTERVTVPGVQGYSKEEATQILEEKGLTVKYDYGQSDRVGIGEVISQSITSGTEVSAGTEITLTINSEEAQESDTQDTTETPGTTTAKSWICNEKVGAPSNYTGGAVKLVLEQTVNGEKAETTILESDAISFPYELNITGASGVTSGKVLMYEMVNGTYKLRCNWPVSFSEQ